jgi:hypothetical protein
VVSDRPIPQAADVGRGPTSGPALHDRDTFYRPFRRLGHDATAKRGTKAPSKAASPGLGSMQSSRHHPSCSPERYRGADLCVHRSRRGAALGDRLLRDPRTRVHSNRRCCQPQCGSRDDVHVRANRTTRHSTRSSSVILSLTTISSEIIDLGSPTYGASSNVGVPNRVTTLKRFAKRRPDPIGLAHAPLEHQLSSGSTFGGTKSSASIR